MPPEIQLQEGQDIFSLGQVIEEGGLESTQGEDIDLFSLGEVMEESPMQMEDSASGSPFAQSKKILRDRAREAGLIDVDIETGVQDFGIRAKFSMLDTEEERQSFLSQTFGSDGFRQTSLGSYVITPEGARKAGVKEFGKPLLFDELGPSRFDVADFASTAIPTTSATAAGTAAANLGTIPGAAITTMAFGGGMLLNELIDAHHGLNLESPEEIRARISRDITLDLPTELITRGLAPVGRKLIGPNTTRKIDPDAGTTFNLIGSLFKRGELKSTVDVERRELVEQALELGIIPRVDQISGDAASRLPGRAQALVRSIFGDKQERQNARALLLEQRRIIGNLTRNGMRPETVVAQVNAEQEFLERSLAVQGKRVQKAINDEVSAIEKSLGPTFRGRTGLNVQQRIGQAKSTFSEQAKKLYASVDELVGNQKVVPTAKIRGTVEKFLEDFPVLPKETRQFLTNEMNNLPDMVSFRQAQNLRSVLLDTARTPDIISSVGEWQSGQLARSVQRAIDSSFLGNSALAKKALKNANRFYAENIPKFDDVLVAQLTRDLQKGGVPPERVISTMLRTKSGQQVNKIKRLLLRPDAKSNVRDPAGEALWNQARRERWNELLARSKDDLTGEIDAKKLYSEMNELGTAFDAFYGKDSSNIRRLARRLAQNNRKLPPNIGEGNDFLAQALRDEAKAQAAMDKFMADDFVSAMNTFRKNNAVVDATTGQVERVLNSERFIDFVSQPGNELKLRSAKGFFGPDSAEFGSIKNGLLKRVMNSFTKNTDDPIDVVFQGRQLRDAILQNENALNVAFGKEHVRSLKKFAEMTMLVTKKSNLSSGLVAAQIALHPFKNLTRLGQVAAMGMFFNSEAAVRLFTEGMKAPLLRKGTPMASRALGAMMTLKVNEIVNQNAEFLQSQIER